MEIDREKIRAEVEAGYISARRHPVAPLTIYNYTPKAQFDWHWTPETMICRGLILHDDGRIIARPFKKFFAIDQLTEPLPNEPFEVFEKMDGSLGISYWDGKERAIATRGSFTSEQAIAANKMLHEEYPFGIIPPYLTLLFEIISPEHRIVVDYGERSELVLLAAINTESGEEIPYSDLVKYGFGFPVVKIYDGIKDVGELTKREETNREGYVIRFQSGLRVKVKFEEYKRLHKLITGITPRTIWEWIRFGNPMMELIKTVPKEFYAWITTVEFDLRDKAWEIKKQCDEDFKLIPAGTRREKAEFILTRQYPSILFQMLDSKADDVNTSIWKAIYPEVSKPFRREEF